MITHTTYECEVCHPRYATPEAAQECEQQPMPPCPLVVGRRYRNRFDGRTGIVEAVAIGKGLQFDDCRMAPHLWHARFDCPVRDDDLCDPDEPRPGCWFWTVVAESNGWEEVGDDAEPR